MYLAVPLTLYAGERLVRALRSSIKPVKILKVNNLKSYIFIVFMLEKTYLINIKNHN